MSREENNASFATEIYVLPLTSDYKDLSDSYVSNALTPIGLCMSVCLFVSVCCVVGE